jgi:dTMP kinase
MPLAIQWRWKSPNIQAAQTDWEKNRTGESLTQAGNAISEAKQVRYQKARDARRDRIEDEDRRRRIAEEDRKIRSQKETSELIRQRKTERDQLVAQRAQIQAQIEQLKAKLGG